MKLMCTTVTMCSLLFWKCTLYRQRHNKGCLRNSIQSPNQHLTAGLEAAVKLSIGSFRKLKMWLVKLWMSKACLYVDPLGSKKSQH
ncbi:toxin-antitoxin system, antitoxin component, Xre domain protein [Ancylostoma caninum]|uniref:Toxin-antitoxin system, antitoxin component, Xre domain protein n=1 Tax=Ancylostoma caninum TaxID=29170 RepID=A0A368F2B6_ANCCA|nr:toxin-antitoxin system, antitoxin component, Xre domain protein [Ancylostoma caninum]